MKENNNIEQMTESDVPIEEKISFLKQPSAYSDQDVEVEAKETHMSWVFLVDDVAYKLKKPVTNRLFDFRTLEARLKNCKEEVRLNKRLSGDIYLGIVALTINEVGKIQIEGKGKIIDWLVKMKRIPEENFLDFAIRHQKANEALVKGAAQLLSVFYKNASSIRIDPDLFMKKAKDQIISTHSELVQQHYHLPFVLVQQISNNLLQFAEHQYLLFAKRIENRKIIEAHGDLRPEHICLAPQPAIIDALEFSRELRIMDIAEELSFLSMECEMMGDLTTGQLFFDCYTKLCDDSIPESLIFFYKAKKAFLRAYLVARHITESGYKDDPKWLIKANAYLQLARKYNNKLFV